MEGEVPEFQDWEVLHSSDSVIVNPNSSLLNSPGGFDEIDGASEGMIRSEYFSIDSVERYGKNLSQSDPDEENSVHSNSPSWIDPGSENQYPRKNFGEFWSDSSSDRSDGRKHGDFEEYREPSGGKNVKMELGFGEIGEMGAADSSEFGSNDISKYTLLSVEDNVKNELDIERHVETESLMKSSGKSWSDSCGESGKESVVVGDYKSTKDDTGILDAHLDGEARQLNDTENIISRFSSEEGKRKVVWWKVPLELLKYCAFRINPVWSVSLAAAVIGLVILGRKIYKTKRKTRSLELKVIVDDKKVSQFLSRAARLNEAFSVVRRVPIIQRTMPPTGLAPWPVMSLR